MINTSSVEQASYRFQMLTDDQIQEIIHAAFDVMRTVGFRVMHEGARKLLALAGTEATFHLMAQALAG